MKRIFSILRNQGIFISGLVLFLLFSILFWRLEYFREKNRLIQQTEILGLQFVHSLENEYALVDQSLQRMLVRGDPFSRNDVEEWARDASFFVDSFDGLRQIAWVDDQYRLQKLVTGTHGSIDIDGPVSSFFPEEPENGFLLWFPAMEEGLLKGFLLTEVDIRAMAESILKREMAIEIAISIGSRSIYRGRTPLPPETYSLSIEFEPVGKGVVEIGASREGLREIQLQSLSLLLFGLFLTLLASGTYLLAWTKARKAKISEKRFQNIFSASRDAVFLVDMQGRYIDVNSAAIELTGYSKSKLMRMYTRDIHSSADMEELNQIRQQGGTFRIDVFHSDGRRIPVELTVSPIVGANGRKDYAMGIARDLSGRLAYEEQLKKSLSEREVLIRELYHRTKNNMQNIISLLQMESLRSENPRIKVMMQDISHKILSMALVHQMLYSSGSLSQIDLKEYVLALFNTLKAAQGEVFSFSFDLEPLKVKIDTAIPLGMILAEWYTNTLKHAYTPHFNGIRTISLGLRKQKGNIVLEYSDHGDRLSSTQPLIASSEIGLKTVRDIAEKQLGGSLVSKIEGGLIWKLEFNDDRYSERITFLDD